MPTSFRQMIGVATGAVSAFLVYKMLYTQLSFISNELLRAALSGIPGIILGIGVMYLILRGEKDRP